MIVVITGRPGVGKSTVFSRVINTLKQTGFVFYGFYCPEVRERGSRVGFKIVNLYSGEFGWLALTVNKAIELGYNIKGKRIGKYVVVEDEAARVGLNALRMFKNDVNSILGIDEIGPMELSIQVLREEIIKSISYASKALLVIHRNLSDNDIITLLRKKNAKIFTVTEGNRDTLPSILINELIRAS